jgi:hypothetical protein
LSHRTLAAVVAVALPLVAAPAAAHGATLCVHQPAGCAGAAYTSVQGALDAAAAAPGRDRIEVGEHAGAAGEAFDVAPGNAVDLVGVGANATVLAAGATPVRIREGSAVVRDLAIRSRDGATRLVAVVAGTLQDVDVVPRASTAVAVRLGGAATLRRVHVEDPDEYGDETAVAIAVDGAGAVLEDVDAFAARTLEVSGGDVAITRSSLRGGQAAARITGGALTADDSAFLAGGQDAVAVDVAPGAGASAAVTLRSVTVAGGYDAGAGLRATCGAGGATATVSLLDTLAIGAATDLARSGAGCAVALDHVGYGTRAGTFADAAGVVGGDMEPYSWAHEGQAVVGPGWLSRAHDGGTARAAAAGETDLNGDPRVVDAARDLGAVEYQHRPPTVRVVPSEPVVDLGRRAEVAANGADPDGEPVRTAWTIDGVAVEHAWQDLPDGFDVGPFSPSLIFRPTAGPHAIGVTVTDPSGLSVHAETTVTARDAHPGIVVARPPAPAPDVAPTGPGLYVLAHAPRLGRDHTLGVTLRCAQTTAPCRGSVRARLTGRRGLAATLAPVSFAIPAGKVKTVKLPVPAKVRAALKRARGATATVTVWHGPRATGARWATAKQAVKA